jgi:RimJ/RimL family protein N-acetyltransferase
VRPRHQPFTASPPGRESERVLEAGRSCVSFFAWLSCVTERLTERLLLRRWRVGDAVAFAALNADPEVMRWIGGGRVLGRGLSDDLIARFEREWDERGFGLWALSRRDDPDGELLGFCGLTVPMFLPAVLPAVEVGWRLARGAWGRGYATEAAREAVAWGFSEQPELREIIAIVDPGNDRSLRVAGKLGMTPRPDRVHPGTGRRVRVLGLSRELQCP